MNDILESMWQEINQIYFNNELQPLADIEWCETGGEHGIGAHGVYFPKSHAIAIDQRFKFEIQKLVVKNAESQVNADFNYRLMLHEMIHQSLHEKGVLDFGKHRSSFVEEAERIAKILKENGIEVDPPTADNAYRWPGLSSKQRSSVS